MSRFAHHAATRGRDTESDLLQTRYVAVPIALWCVGMFAAIGASVFHAAAQPATSQVPAHEQFACSARAG